LDCLLPSPPHSGAAGKTIMIWNSPLSFAHSIGKDEWYFCYCFVLLEEALILLLWWFLIVLTYSLLIIIFKLSIC
jgi:hypothetical protein